MDDTLALVAVSRIYPLRLRQSAPTTSVHHSIKTDTSPSTPTISSIAGAAFKRHGENIQNADPEAVCRNVRLDDFTRAFDVCPIVKNNELRDGHHARPVGPSSSKVRIDF
jgi:hypothetical protein